MFARSIILRAAMRRYSTAPPAGGPPLLLTLREDLKAAMRAKDRQRLDIVKSILADITNANKTKDPVQSDIDILQLINKTKGKAAESVNEALKAGREDIAEKERAGVKLLEEYAAKVEVVSEEELKQTADKVVKAMMEGDGKVPAMGQAIKNMMKELEGRPAVKADAVRVVQAVLKEVKA